MASHAAPCRMRLSPEWFFYFCRYLVRTQPKVIVQAIWIGEIELTKLFARLESLRPERPDKEWSGTLFFSYFTMCQLTRMFHAVDLPFEVTQA